MKDFFEGIASFFESTFEMLPPLGNIPNVLFGVIIFVAFIYWMLQLKKFSRSGSRFDKYLPPS